MVPLRKNLTQVPTAASLRPYRNEMGVNEIPFDAIDTPFIFSILRDPPFQKNYDGNTFLDVNVIVIIVVGFFCIHEPVVRACADYRSCNVRQCLALETGGLFRWRPIYVCVQTSPAQRE